MGYRKIIYLAIVFLWGLETAAQQIYKILPQELNIPHVDSVLTLLNNNAIANPVYNLEKIIHISEEIDYKQGAHRGYKLLIDIRKKENNAPLHLRVLLQYAHFIKDTGDTIKLRGIYSQIADLYFENGIYEKAIENYNTVLNSSDGVFEKNTLKKLGSSYFRSGKYPEAKQCLNSILTESRKLADWETVLWGMQRLSGIYHQTKAYNNELEINKQIVALTDSLHLPDKKILALNNLAYTYKFLDKPAEAIQYFTDAKTNTPNSVNANIYQNLAILYQNQQEFHLASENYNNALKLYQALNDKKNEAQLLNLLALTYYQLSDFQSALRYNDNTVMLTKENNLGTELQTAYYTKSLIHQSLNEYQDALESFNTYLKIKDSLETNEFRRQNEITQQQYFLSKTEQELTLNWISEDMKDLEIEKLHAQSEAARERVKAFQSDSLLTMQKLINQQLMISEFEKNLALEREKNRVIERENEITILDQIKEKQKLELSLEKIESQKKADSLLLEKSNNKVLAFELKERLAVTKNLLYLLFALLVIAVMFIFFYLNVRKKNRQIALQKSLLSKEKDKSDSLLLNILPKAVAEELKEKGKSPPRSFKMVSILFTDFSGFTQISEKLSPPQLLKKLDDIFLEFDLIVERNGLTRIKTIGDAYMCVAGLPNKDTDHAKNAVLTALEMRDYIETFNATLLRSEPKWNIRIGVNSGPVVAGVVGIKKFAYDIWGDAVNLASRMESSGEIKKVNISQSTYDLVKSEFRTEYRGKIFAKSKGNIDMYFVEK